MRIYLIGAILTLSGCASVSPLTTNDSKNTWIVQRLYGVDLVFWCSAGEKTEPKCYQAEMYSRGSRSLTQEEIDSVYNSSKPSKPGPSLTPKQKEIENDIFEDTNERNLTLKRCILEMKEVLYE